MQKIVVINPNSTLTVTEAIDRAMEPLRSAGGPAIECDTLAEGPPGIESDEHIAGVIVPLLQWAERRQDADAIVIACFSDPGLAELRAQSSKPVLGISECAMLTALSLGGKFGVLSILPQSVPRHLRYIRALGLEARCAGDLPIGFGVTELEAEPGVFSRMAEVGRSLRDDKGAEVLILGCAGMADYRQRLEEETGLPVVEPSQAAASMTIAQLRLGWQRANAAMVG